MCNKINTVSVAYEMEEETMCRLCNATKGIRIEENNNNWQSQIMMTDNE